jgi:hypothetical protein
MEIDYMLATSAHCARRRTAHLRLVVDNPDLAYSEFCEALRRWHRLRAIDPKHPARLEAFAALKAWAPDTAKLYGDGSKWGFN